MLKKNPQTQLSSYNPSKNTPPNPSKKTEWNCSISYNTKPPKSSNSDKPKKLQHRKNKKTPIRDNQDNYIMSLYMKEISKHTLLTPKEENDLVKIAFGKNTEKAKAAREQLITRNLKLVVTIAKRYQGNGLDLMDLISEGNIGLAKSVDKFDPSKGTKLSTYAAPWIKHTIQKAISNKGRTIRIPNRTEENTRKLAKLSQQLEQELKREPTEEELAEEMGIPVARIKNMLAHNPKFIPLDAPKSWEDPHSETVGDSLPDPNAEDPKQKVEEQEQEELLKISIKTLSPRERTIIENRFGIDETGIPKTLEAIGTKFQMTRERIRQIQNTALKKLQKRMENFSQSPKIRFAA